MTTMDPGSNNNKDNTGYFDKDAEEIKNKLDLTKQFSIRNPLSKVELMNKEQLISFAKYMIVTKAYMEQTFANVVSMGNKV